MAGVAPTDHRQARQRTKRQGGSLCLWLPLTTTYCRHLQRTKDLNPNPSLDQPPTLLSPPPELVCLSKKETKDKTPPVANRINRPSYFYLH
ncbi:hypothetical protein BJY04DRAFT_177159 [Aspergillus karnatakaensis]|uniref:uncharacterized protein n=1 Tax=Aspergillus karnatakaensis TaxID=1810916 RepID=UPI003CCCFB40